MEHKKKYIITGIISVFTLLLLGMTADSQMIFAKEGGRVLFISSYEYSWDTVPLQMEGIEEALADDVSLSYEFMDTKRVNDEEGSRLFYEHLSHTLDMVEDYDVIIVGDDAALKFALDYQDELFDGIPIIFEGINDIERARKAAEDNLITGVVERLSYRDTLDLAVSLYPDAKRIVGIVDDTITGEGEKKQFHANEAEYPEFTFEELNTSLYSKDEFAEKLSEIGEDTIVFYLICSEDKDGNTYTGKEAAALIGENTRVPVFRMVQAGIGSGLFGGEIVSHKESGAIAGRMAMQILNGTDPAEISMVEESPNMYYFDEQVMQKFGISRKQLPEDAVFINKKVSFLEKNAKAVVTILVVTVILLLVMGIMGISLHLKERNRTLEVVQTRNGQLAEAIQAAEHANKAKTTFLSRMSHEIRTPMNAILGITSLTRNCADNPSKVKENLDKIEVSSKMLLNIINDVLDMSAIENEKIRIGHSPFDFKQVLSSLTTMYYTLCKQKGIQYDMILAGVTEEVLVGDQLRLNQILNNLLSNALKFTESGGQIKLIVTQQDIEDKKVYFQFTVQDSGCGMSEDMKSRIFKPFEQESAQTALNHGGSGLGMSITKNLVELMQGAVSVESEKGKGSTFTVSLPFERAENTESKIQDMRALKVLVADDDKNTRDYMAVVLQHIGVEFHIVGSGKEAIEELRRADAEGKPYEVCFTDWQMPEVSGLDLIRKIRKEWQERIFIAVISGYDLNEAEEEAKSAGADLCLAKPLFQSTIFNVIMELSGGAYTRITADEDEYDLNGMRILLVDDTEFNLDVAEELLEMVGIEVDCARNGQEAIDRFESSMQGYYDAILMDVQMPVLDGHEATRRIRRLAREDAASVPILAMTANAFTEDVTASLEAGMNDHITKPIDTQILYSRLNKYYHHLSCIEKDKKGDIRKKD